MLFLGTIVFYPLLIPNKSNPQIPEKIQLWKPYVNYQTEVSIWKPLSTLQEVYGPRQEIGILLVDSDEYNNISSDRMKKCTGVLVYPSEGPLGLLNALTRRQGSESYGARL